jgi:thioredoxin reductase (NADPH)
MSMFDYDARPVTPVPVLVGTTASRGAYAIRDFLSRNGYAFEWVDAGQPDAATRAVVQARRFGAELLLARPLAGVSADGPGYVAGLSDGTLVRGRAVLFASGVEWRRLEVPGIDDLLGAGVYYGAGPSEALACTGSRVAVVGGGNSAGQAVVRFSRYARQVTLLVRGGDLGASMSQYLIDHLSGISDVEVRVRTQVVGLEADDRLRGIIVRSGGSTEPVQMPADALFICIGGTPRTDGATGIGLAANTAGYLVTGSDGASDPGGSWPLLREPLPLETNRPGVFAAGDVRCGSVKRCAAAIGEGSMAVALVHRWLAEAGGD